MATFNSEVNIEMIDKAYAGMILMGLLPEDELANIKEDWNKQHGKDPSKYPWWKFCLDSIEVSYKKGE